MESLLNNPQLLATTLGVLFTLAIVSGVVIKAKKDLTENLVTKQELDLEILRLKESLSKDLQTTRHQIRNEINSVTLNLENKIDAGHAEQTKIGEAVARIEGAVSAGQRLAGKDTK